MNGKERYIHNKREMRKRKRNQWVMPRILWSQESIEKRNNEDILNNTEGTGVDVSTAVLFFAKWFECVVVRTEKAEKEN